MDRRMYRGVNRNVSPYRTNAPVCGDVVGRYEPECGCGYGDNEEFCKFPLAMSYVPWQCFRNLFENEFVALKNGTIFKELDLEWYGRSCK